MPRTIDDIPDPAADRWPPAGWHDCVLVEVHYWRSPRKGTPGVRLTFQSEDGNYRFSDAIWMTPKAINRWKMLALHICQFPRALQLPDEDAHAVRQLADYVVRNGPGCRGRVLIEEEAYEYFDQETGRRRRGTRHRVAFAGFAAPESPAEDRPEPAADLEPADAETLPGNAPAAPGPLPPDDIPF